MTIFHDQSSFMTIMGQSQTKDNAALYAELVHEEAARELIPAMARYLAAPTTENLTEVVDGGIDSIVVIAGLLNCLIGPDKAQQAWEEVQRSNMSKATWDDATQSYKVLRRGDGKVLKPATFSPPNLFDIVATLPTPEGMKV